MYLKMVTEIACIDRNYQAVVNFTVQICNWLDSKDWVFEYGLFDFQRKVADGFVSPAAQLMDGNGNFTELGKMYVHQQPMKAPGKANVAMNSFAVADISGGDAEAEGDETLTVEGGETGEPLSHDPNDASLQAAAAGAEGGVEEMAAFSVAAALSADQQKALDLHNNKRKSKGVKALVWDNQLAQNATAYAQHLAKIGKLEHSSGDQRPNQGENLAW